MFGQSLVLKFRAQLMMPFLANKLTVLLLFPVLYPVTVSCQISLAASHSNIGLP